MNIEICLHRQLKANIIYPNFKKDENNDKTDPSWDELYSYFQNNEKLRNGIYFYHYGNSEIPFYIGKSTATSYNILGRVWEEIDDYAKGRYWFPKDVTKLANAVCYKSDGFRDDIFFKPPISHNDELFKEQRKLFLSNVSILFSYMTSDAIIDKKDLIHLSETVLQNRLIDNLNLERGWIGDGGSNLTRVDMDETEKIIFDLKYENISFKLDDSIFKLISKDLV